jgi:hypothetical protein
MSKNASEICLNKGRERVTVDIVVSAERLLRQMLVVENVPPVVLADTMGGPPQGDYDVRLIFSQSAVPASRFNVSSREAIEILESCRNT